MKKKVVLSIVICLIGFSLILIIKTGNKIENKKSIAVNISRLPDLTITKPDFSNVAVNTISNQRYFILIVFNTTCDICHHEIKGVLDSIKRFDKVKIVMISSEPMDSIIKFQRKYEFNKYPSILLGQVNDVYASQVLGVVIIPQIFIYNSEKKLIKVYKGETKLDAILKYTN